MIRSRKSRAMSFGRSVCAVAVLASTLLLILASCRLYNLERKLPPDDAEFLSLIRYIMTGKERKIFLELPPSEREAFKDEFWKRRDPDPATEENEFKMEYMDRVEKANELFVTEGKKGYLTDRGRIFILFGPPTDRITYPQGFGASTYCQEFWYYGVFPVKFIDRTCTGQFQLVTYDLTPLREINLMYMHELTLAQARAQETFFQEKRLFDFRWKLEREVSEAERFEGTVVLEIPYRAIWFTADEGRLKTTLDLRIELRDFERKIVWEREEAVEIVMSEDELKIRRGKMHKVEVPILLEEGVDRLRQGKSLLHVFLKNRTGGEELKKVMEILLSP